MLNIPEIKLHFTLKLHRSKIKLVLQFSEPMRRKSKNAHDFALVDGAETSTAHAKNL